ncbi:hypothetical protein [Enterococcus sp.]|uniref:hypothetical protein n=1 Tax=Enterococcus sp. TaxID=35783 RepID=UPI0029157864|nr:hypothetical protein [Enterococcus sp.]MDU5335447.1 hypothetical protein [Enterococcus sp.]
MENKKKMIIMGTIALFSTSLLFQNTSLADDVFSPINPNQKVKPVESSSSTPETTESSVEVASMEPDRTTDSSTEKQSKKQPEKKSAKEQTVKRKKRYLDDSFFSNESNQFTTLNSSGTPGGSDDFTDARLAETMKVLSGIALYGRKK